MNRLVNRSTGSVPTTTIQTTVELQESGAFQGDYSDEHYATQKEEDLYSPNFDPFNICQESVETVYDSEQNYLDEQPYNDDTQNYTYREAGSEMGLAEGIKVEEEYKTYETVYVETVNYQETSSDQTDYQTYTADSMTPDHFSTEQYENPNLESCEVAFNEQQQLQESVYTQEVYHEADYEQNAYCEEVYQQEETECNADVYEQVECYNVYEPVEGESEQVQESVYEEKYQQPASEQEVLQEIVQDYEVHHQETYDSKPDELANYEQQQENVYEHYQQDVYEHPEENLQEIVKTEYNEEVQDQDYTSAALEDTTYSVGDYQTENYQEFSLEDEHHQDFISEHENSQSSIYEYGIQSSTFSEGVYEHGVQNGEQSSYEYLAEVENQQNILTIDMQQCMIAAEETVESSADHHAVNEEASSEFLEFPASSITGSLESRLQKAVIGNIDSNGQVTLNLIDAPSNDFKKRKFEYSPQPVVECVEGCWYVVEIEIDSQKFPERAIAKQVCEDRCSYEMFLVDFDCSAVCSVDCIFEMENSVEIEGIPSMGTKAEVMGLDGRNLSPHIVRVLNLQWFGRVVYIIPINTEGNNLPRVRLIDESGKLLEVHDKTVSKNVVNAFNSFF